MSLSTFAKNPKELIRLFYQSLLQRRLILKDDVEERYMPEDLESLPEKQQELIDQWCSQVLLAEVFKLLGNSAYGKFIEAVERQTKVMYTKDEDEVDGHLRSAYFEDLEEIGDAYKMESRKNKVTINRPFQVGIVVYQLAKLRMLQFYYDFLDKYIDRRDYELIQMDTDSMYFALSYDNLEEAVKPELLKEFERGEKAMALLEQVEQQRAWLVQT